MSEYSFSFIVSGVDTSNDDFVSRFYEAGCDDATLALMKGFLVVSFDREAEDYVHAVVSAFHNTTVAGGIIERFEPDYLVSQSEIAKRANLSRSAVSLWVSGERGINFPKPCARITTESPLWDWVVVSSWLHKCDHLGLNEVVNARIGRTINLACQQSRLKATGLGERKLIDQIRKAAAEPVFADC